MGGRLVILYVLNLSVLTVIVFVISGSSVCPPPPSLCLCLCLSLSLSLGMFNDEFVYILIPCVLMSAVFILSMKLIRLGLILERALLRPHYYC